MCRWNYDRVDEDGWRWPESQQLQGTVVPAIVVRDCLQWLMESRMLPLLALCSVTGVHRTTMAKIIRARAGRTVKIPAFEALALVELSQRSLADQCRRRTSGHHARALVQRLYQAGVSASQLEHDRVPAWVQRQVLVSPRRAIEARYEHLLAGIAIHRGVDCDYQRSALDQQPGAESACDAA